VDECAAVDLASGGDGVEGEEQPAHGPGALAGGDRDVPGAVGGQRPPDQSAADGDGDGGRPDPAEHFVLYDASEGEGGIEEHRDDRGRPGVDGAAGLHFGIRCHRSVLVEAETVAPVADGDQRPTDQQDGEKCPGDDGIGQGRGGEPCDDAGHRGQSDPEKGD